MTGGITAPVIRPVFGLGVALLPTTAAAKPVFWLESLALWAFGISWATKREMLLRDA